MSVSTYYDSIKQNKAKLRQFIADMPKGADLHNHLIGAVYAETIFDIACNAHLYANLSSGKLYESKPSEVDTVKLCEGMDDFHNVRMTLIDKWSIRDYQPYKFPLGPDEYFFSLFGNFIAAAANKYLPEFVREIKIRAKEENVQYIETVGIAPSVPADAYLSDKYDSYHKAITEACERYNNAPQQTIQELRNILTEIFSIYDTAFNDKNSEIYKAVTNYSAENDDILYSPASGDAGKFDESDTEDNNVLVKLQGYADRNNPPLLVYCQLYIIHKAISLNSSSLVGCNIVAAENSENSMKYYKAHMVMFDVLNERFDSKVKIALHAGELTMGLVPPEHLTYHVTDAVKIANANRIGHGVDIVFEHDSHDLLEQMKIRDIPIEINLTSNEFILGVKDDSHPFNIYRESGVPIIISTDDPGILRTSITEEYTLAAYRYELSYDDIKNIISNSIKYSFLNETDKQAIRDAYDKKLEKFEAKYADR